MRSDGPALGARSESNSAAAMADYIPIVTNVPVFHWAVGEASELGWYCAEAKFQLLQFTSQTTGEFDSAVPCVFTSVNGDELVFTYGDTTNGAKQPGSVDLYPLPSGEFIGVFVAEFNPVPAKCTGKFKNVVRGSFTMVAVTEPFVLGAKVPVDYWWIGDGWIEYGKGK
jgi:hypothetical protein